ncbi:hypothetical protein BDP27DRAFT_1424396 [Rhodocollybia butyracea]|uniref:Uncharacterized protein n=1 Tax=Rhodocollybia butyracea TaxID=206335 RepID=A0A9P5U4R2_9AGAR|nr:hypothetical protein BDP27DRAFT_1424396 [Rhodocollybia butyracea]
MSNTLVLATYSKARRLLDKAISVVDELLEAVTDMPDTYIRDIPHIRRIVESLDPILHEQIPILLTILRKQSLPPIRGRIADDFMPLYVPVYHVDPTLLLVLKTLKRRLLDLSRRLDQWPVRGVILEGIIVDMEEVFWEMIPEVRSAITGNELSDIEYRYMFAADPKPYHDTNHAHVNIQSSSIAPSDASNDILDTTAVNQWLAKRPSTMQRVPSPPIYDSDHPDHVSDESKLSSDDELDELDSDNDFNVARPSDDGEGESEYSGSGYAGDESN